MLTPFYCVNRNQYLRIEKTGDIMRIFGIICLLFVSFLLAVVFQDAGYELLYCLPFELITISISLSELLLQPKSQLINHQQSLLKSHQKGLAKHQLLSQRESQLTLQPVKLPLVDLPRVQQLVLLLILLRNQLLIQPHVQLRSQRLSQQDSQQDSQLRDRVSDLRRSPPAD